MATIISFANQKGGVGKTTLCTTFANYLAKQGERLLVLDCDSQQSIYEKRKADQRKYPNLSFGYNVQEFDIANAEKVTLLMAQVKSLDGIVLLDTPGHLSQQGLIPLFVNSDFIVCPYQYESASINSTITFLKFFKELKGRVATMSTKLLLVANRYDKRVGRKEELELWANTDQAFAKYGEILPRVEVKADMQRYNTVSLMDTQLSITEATFNRIFELIKENKYEYPPEKTS